MTQKKAAKEQTKRKVWVYRGIVIVLGIGFLISAAVILTNAYAQKRAKDHYKEMSEKTQDPEPVVQEEVKKDPEPVQEPEEEKLDILSQRGIEIPPKDIDFAALKEENPDIYAWLYVPGTQVDYPVLQHPEDDTFYLEHNVDGSEGLPGCIYTEAVNSKEFTDPHTVMYGHNMKDGSMFASLHDFSDQTVFEENRFMFVYTPDKTFVYEIFGAYEYNAIHLVYNFDLGNEEIFQNYLDQIFEIRDMGTNLRPEIKLTAQNHILTLSTCVAGEKNKRFLVQGVLLNED